MKFKLDQIEDVFAFAEKLEGYADVAVGLIEGGKKLFDEIRGAFQSSGSGELTLDELRVIVADYRARQAAINQQYDDRP